MDHISLFAAGFILSAAWLLRFFDRLSAQRKENERAVAIDRIMRGGY
jgi:hypothetical protein